MRIDAVDRVRWSADRRNRATMLVVARRVRAVGETRELRRQRVRRIRRQIAAGTYSLDDKLDVVLERLQRDLQQ
jgi:anti-sigma28 factor (negative regulator of flagellin synthesis)